MGEFQGTYIKDNKAETCVSSELWLALSNPYVKCANKLNWGIKIFVSSLSTLILILCTLHSEICVYILSDEMPACEIKPHRETIRSHHLVHLLRFNHISHLLLWESQLMMMLVENGDFVVFWCCVFCLCVLLCCWWWGFWWLSGLLLRCTRR